MSKQRRTTILTSLGDPSLDHASALVQEYTSKLRTINRQIRDIRDSYLAANQRRLKQTSASSSAARNNLPGEQELWLETLNGFRSRHDECARYALALVPQARKLAQHVSQLITHGTPETIGKIELSLRVAELESAIQAVQVSASYHLAFQVP